MASKSLHLRGAEIQTTLDGFSNLHSAARSGTTIPISFRKKTKELADLLTNADNSVARLFDLHHLLSTTPDGILNHVKLMQDWASATHKAYDPAAEALNPAGTLSKLAKDSKALFYYVTGQHDYRLAATMWETLDALRAFTQAFRVWDADFGQFTSSMPLPKMQGEMPFYRWVDVEFARGLETPLETKKDFKWEGAYEVTTTYSDIHSCYIGAKHAMRRLRWTLHRNTITGILDRLDSAYPVCQAYTKMETYFPKMMWDRLFLDATAPSGHSLFARSVNEKLHLLLRRADHMYADRARALEETSQIEPRRL